MCNCFAQLLHPRISGSRPRREAWLASCDCVGDGSRGLIVKANKAPKDPRWLLLIHQIPPKPAYFRAKVGRGLQRVGAVAIKNSVYALPMNEQTQEDFQWVAREIV